MKLKCAILIILYLSIASARWTEQEADRWYAKFNWSAGFNYAPSYAVNEI